MKLSQVNWKHTPWAYFTRKFLLQYTPIIIPGTVFFDIGATEAPLPRNNKG